MPIPNASFEDSDSRNPLGWTFTGRALSNAWTSEEPFSGNRALRIDARYGSQRWDSVPIPVRPDQKHLLRWQTRYHGEKAWRFRASFCGVEVIFKDSTGRVLGKARQHSNCWQTVGWEPAWFAFTTPRGARTIGLGFVIETLDPLPGGFDVDTMELEEMPPTPPGGQDMCLLTVKTEDENGAAVAARVRIANQSGEPVRPAGAIAYDRVDGAFHPLEEGVCYAVLPRGGYTVSVTRGFEYEPCERAVDVTEAQVNLTLKLRRASNWRQLGWVSGDHHTHLYRHGGSRFPTLGWPDVLRVARSEGLDFLPFMGADLYPSEAQLSAVDRARGDFVYELTEEITEDFWGHVCPIGAAPHARHDPRYAAGPMNIDRYAAIAGSGGVLCYGHPYGLLGDGEDVAPLAAPGSGLVAREFPLDLALGMPCAIDLLAMEGSRNGLKGKLRDLYRLWNLGFRPAVAASTDFHVDQGRQPIGAVRTYVRSGVLNMVAIAQAYRAGRTFASSGPLLDLRVAGAGPGEEVRLPTPGERLQVKVEAVSIGKLDRVEIVVNGVVAQTFKAEGPHRISGSFELTARRGLWVAASAYGPADRYLASELEGRPLGAGQFAHTSPVYVLVEGEAVLAARTSDAEYFVRWCDAVLAGWRRHVGEKPDDARHETVVTARVARARKVFAELAERLR